MNKHIIFFGMLIATASSCAKRPCTEIGCSDGLNIEINTDENVAVAVIASNSEGDSQTIACGGGGDQCVSVFTVDDFEVDQVEVTLSEDGNVIKCYTEQVEYKETRPNGKGCDPVCKQANIEVRA